MAMVLKDGVLKVNWMSVTMNPHSLDIYQTQFIRDDGDETSARWPSAASVIEEVARKWGTLDHRHKQHWIITTEEPMTPKIALRICEQIQNIWDIQGIDFVRFDLDKLARAVGPKVVTKADFEEPVGPDSFGGEDAPPAPSAKEIRKSLEDEGVTIREAKAALDEVMELKKVVDKKMSKRKRRAVPKLDFAEVAQLTIEQLIERSQHQEYREAAREMRWKIEFMCAAKTLNIKDVYEALL